MPSQNLNSFYRSNYSLKLDYSRNFDLTLTNDEREYDEEVVFSSNLIAQNDGNRLPIYIDLSNGQTSPRPVLTFGDYIPTNTLVSKNIYNPKNLDFSCYTSYTGICDVGLVATDNGLYNEMSGQTLYYIKGIDDTYKFNPHYRDSRFKMHPVTGYTQQPNVVFSGRPKNTIYNIVSKNTYPVGYHQELYGGFYQGFYKLFGYDYEVFPERVNKGWSVEMVLKPRIVDQYSIDTTTETYLNNLYPQNAGTFFFLGARAENKFYHNASGNPQSDSGYTRVTENLSCIKSCACSNTGITNSNCISIYPNSATTTVHNVNCNCGCASTEIVPLPETDPKFDTVSNAFSLRLDGDPFNPRIAIKYLKITGDCVTTGSCETEGVSYQTGATITEVFTPPIYDICNYDTCNSQTERWVLVSAVFERYTNLEDCQLLNLGGLGDIRKVTYQSSLDNQSYKLISPPQTHLGDTKEPKVYQINLNKKWTDQLDYRLGLLKIYVNGYLFFIIEDFEEIIPRELNTEKEKQIGVPFNISWGGGTQGLHDHLIFSGCSNPFGPYTQDPELFPNNILSATTLSGLSTNILLEQNFGGTFMGGISQFRMYTEPLSSPQIQHNFRILKNNFNLFDYWCPDCFTNDIVDESGHKLLTDNGGGLIFCVYDPNPNDNYVFAVDIDDVIVYIEAIFSQGSVVMTNNVRVSKALKSDYKATITKKVEFIDETIYVTSEVLIPAGQLSGSTVTIIDKDYNKLLNTSNIESVENDYNGALIQTVKSFKTVLFNNVPLSTTTTTTEDQTTTTTTTEDVTTTTTTTLSMNKVYYGKIPNIGFNQNNLSSLNIMETNNILSSYLFYNSGPGYCYILVPENMSQPQLFRNSNEGCEGFVIPFMSLGTTEIIDSNGSGIIYYVYRSFVSTRARVDVWVCD
jgi:hypothetical protein